MTDKEWFKSWFDTKYYHILYKDRDVKEADRFIENLVQQLNMPKGCHVLDLACGKGRHSKKLFDLGYQVVGADLSANSISAAKLMEDQGLEFVVHDMRKPIVNRKFDFVFNLFTSFGYFDHTSDNDAVLRSVYEMLNPGGILVLDFMNAEKVITNLVTSEIKVVDGIQFEIERIYDQNHITKRIAFTDQGEKLNFQERVQALKLEDFQQLMLRNGFNILRTFGNFDLEHFDTKESDRLIIIAAKSE